MINFRKKSSFLHMRKNPVKFLEVSVRSKLALCSPFFEMRNENHQDQIKTVVKENLAFRFTYTNVNNNFGAK